ncbi:hypothetical protein SAMN05216267_101088 [Actinacidiphila rubida]|uniref:GerMN domain-containing protein n=1 Tax=Actinacidiphila rubida TaxID=310780 RepID=A0A1H8JGJ7_9ACTN|nr:hypothetical protein [Actinacidiphila rubida]SEN79416.1 hypothetical protein SAMN05216267_101088 [Actinacidiphila rubida]
MVTGLAAALALTACGVPSSGVIEAGEPATGVSSPAARAAAPGAVAVYFLRDGKPAPYIRKALDPGDVGLVVRLLFAGPTAGEAAATTQLPHLGSAPEVSVDGVVTVRLPEGVPALSHLAMLQLACTVTRIPQAAPRLAAPSGTETAPAPGDGAQRLDPSETVRVLGDGWTMTQSASPCPPSPPPR